MSVESEITRINGAVTEQTALIQEITDILEGKAGGGGSETSFKISKIRFWLEGPVGVGVEPPKINITLNDKEVLNTMVGFGDYDVDFVFDLSKDRVGIIVSSTLFTYSCKIDTNTMNIMAFENKRTKITEIYFGGFTDNFGDGNYTIQQMDCSMYMGKEDTIDIFDLQSYTDTPFTDFTPFFSEQKALPITAIFKLIIDDGISYSWVGSQCYIKDNKMYIKVCMWL